MLFWCHNRTIHFIGSIKYKIKKKSKFHYHFDFQIQFSYHTDPFSKRLVLQLF